MTFHSMCDGLHMSHGYVCMCVLLCKHACICMLYAYRTHPCSGVPCVALCHVVSRCIWWPLLCRVAFGGHCCVALHLAAIVVSRCIWWPLRDVCMRVCMCDRMRACVRAHTRACVSVCGYAYLLRVCMRACVRACMCTCVRGCVDGVCPAQ